MDGTELREGLQAAAPYLLSHHEPEEWDRCYAPVLFGRRVRLCARCLGIYPGIGLGAVAAVAGPPFPSGIALVLVLPAFALFDWVVTTFSARTGVNAVRTATGALLGYAYGLGLVLFVTTLDVRVLAVGAGYGVVAGALLLVARRWDDGRAW